MSSSAPSIRDLARALGLSHTTVSQGLRGHPKIKLETRERVQEMARVMGYRSSALTSTLMSGMRRQRGRAFSGMLAIVDLDGARGGADEGDCVRAFRREMVEGACERAIELGFVPRYFAIGSEGFSRATYDVVLKSHNVCGVLILPSADPTGMSEFDWSGYAVVCVGRGGAEVPFHCVCNDPADVVRTAFRGLRRAGYRRPGLVLRERGADHLLNRWIDAYWSCAGDNGGAPILLAPKPESRSFSNWFRRHDPDVVLCDDVSVMEWMLACGAKIPESHGFFCLNRMPDAGCAGFDQQSRLVGARGVEQVIAQVLRNECGRPEFPLSIIVPGVWVDGPTIRAVCGEGVGAGA